MSLRLYTKNLHTFLEGLGDEDIARRQSQYMRNRFPFFGLMKENLEKYWKEFQEINGKITNENCIEFCLECVQYKERELWYIANKTLVKYRNKLKKEDIKFVKNYLIQSDWWDVVDIISSNVVGALCTNYPELKIEVNGWIRDENFWLRRTAIIYQLTYRSNTDEKILYSHILLTCHEQEFFIRKAIGWALREYSKHNPNSVKAFIEKNRHKLSKLSIQEGSKYV